MSDTLHDSLGLTLNSRAMFVCPKLDAGGAERHWATLLPELASRGMTIRLIAIEGTGRALEQLRQEQIPVRELGAKGLSALSRIPALLTEARHHPDVVVTWSFNAHALGAIFGLLTRTPQVVNWHRQPDLPMTRRQRWSIRLAARSGAGVIAVTQAQLPELYALGFPKERAQVVPNGVEGRTTASKAELRRTLGIPANAFVAVLVARLRPEKRIEDFIEAMGLLRETVPDAVGVVVGDGPEDGALRAFAEARQAPVGFAGYQEDPTRHMVAADVVCLTSAFEALPMSLVEAASVGRPIVATNVGGIDEIVLDGETGRLIPTHRPAALAACLEELAGNPAQRAAMGARAQQLWSDEFSMESMVDRYGELLSTVSGPPTRWPNADTTTT
ncbi:MAG TPA: glycosyltransferase [Microbacteriaceae bacterium]|jgi:glycosyltransferase involved in cell wall biosynthesis|nr:glycosyltransferase [Microbacteriaceae bacterium]